MFGRLKRLLGAPVLPTPDDECACGHARREHIYVTAHFPAVCVHARKGGACTCSKFEAA